MHLKTCAVCDALKREVDFVNELSSNFYNRCRSRLAPDPGMALSLINTYDVSTSVPGLKNVLLSKRGLKILTTVK